MPILKPACTNIGVVPWHETSTAPQSLDLHADPHRRIDSPPRPSSDFVLHRMPVGHRTSPSQWGAPYFSVQGHSAFGDNWLATPMAVWDTLLEGRDSLNWQVGRHSLKFGDGYQRYIWPMWAYVQSRGFYQFTNGFTTQYALNDSAQDRHWPAFCSACRPFARPRRAARRVCSFASGASTRTDKTRGAQRLRRRSTMAAIEDDLGNCARRHAFNSRLLLNRGQNCLLICEYLFLVGQDLSQ